MIPKKFNRIKLYIFFKLHNGSCLNYGLLQYYNIFPTSTAGLYIILCLTYFPTIVISVLIQFLATLQIPLQV